MLLCALMSEPDVGFIDCQTASAVTELDGSADQKKSMRLRLWVTQRAPRTGAELRSPTPQEQRE